MTTKRFFTSCGWTALLVGVLYLALAQEPRTPAAPVMPTLPPVAATFHDNGAFLYEASPVTGSFAWTAELLTRRSLQGEAKRSLWYPDPRLPVPLRVVSESYAGTGYHRGHGAALANHPQHADRTFATSNAAPQAPGLNSGAWRQLEADLRERVDARTQVLVVTAPVYLYRDHEPRAIGADHVFVPTHFAKAALVLRGTRAEAAAAWLAANENEAPLETIAIDELEGLLQRDLFPFLTDADEERLEREARDLLGERPQATGQSQAAPATDH